MPIATNIADDTKLVKLLLIGDTKAGKTYYACQAAADGFNLIYLGGDAERGTLLTASPEALKRILYLDCADSIATARFGKLFNAMVHSPLFLWNDTLGKTLVTSELADSPAVVALSLGNLGPKDVLVIDSWTALAYSVMKEVAERTGSDLGDMEKADRGLYASAGNRLASFLTALQAARCHVIVIAHPDEYMQYKKPLGKVKDAKDGDMVLVKQTMIPKSSSKPHGLTLGKHFTDVMWIEVGRMGNDRWLDGRPDPDRIVGGRFNERKKSTEYSFANLVRSIGGVVPAPGASFDSPGVTIYGPGEYAPPTGGGSLSAPAGQAPTAVKGLSGLMLKKGL